MSGHALVVGGTRGIGRAVARGLLAAGYTVSAIGRRPASSSDLEQAGLTCWAADVAHAAARARTLDAVLARNGKLTHLVFFQRYRGEGDRWEGEWQTSLTATRATIDRCAEVFDGAPEDSIVLASSIAAHFVAGEQPVSYHIAKAALEQMARYYAVALGGRGIRVNCVSPATILKDESKDYYAARPDLLDLYRRLVPLGRMGTADEVASVVVFLCSPAASFMTGQNLTVDGGVSLLGQEALARRLLIPDDRDTFSRRISQ